MKKSILLISIILLSGIKIWSQLNIDILTGISPATKLTSSSIIVNRDRPLDEFQFNLVSSKSQLFGGVKLNAMLNEYFFVEGGLIYSFKENMYEAKYTYTNRFEGDNYHYMNHSKHVILLPVSVGVGVGAVDFTSGLRITRTLSESKELMQIPGFKNECDGISLGWQMGVRFAFNRMLFGVEYQAELERMCDGLSVNTTSLELMNVPGHFVFTLQYRIN